MRAYIRSGLILLVLGFLVMRTVRPFMDAYQFQKLVQKEVEDASQRAGAGELQLRILQHGRAMGLKIGSQDIQVQRLTRGYQVRVSCAVPLDFWIYQTDVLTTFEARSALLAWD